MPWRRFPRRPPVYPRMYGETVLNTPYITGLAGLSPHVRGNLNGRIQREGCLWSIPACTGKPDTGRWRGRVVQVYPRMYGETYRPGNVCRLWTGLSPHVRGNRCWPPPARRCAGSIPACTGKPMDGIHMSTTVRVYPRMYGETGSRRPGQIRNWGLSPHVRGNQVRGRTTWRTRGSIPACTGKPYACVVPGAGWRVYPRMYGETSPSHARPDSAAGLSPHVRGNPTLV